MLKIVALVPMKVHSERVPNKNMKSFNGFPLFHAIMRALEKSNLINEIIINTDSKLIAEEATRNFGKVKIHDRPSEIQGDFVSMNEIIKFDLLNSDADVYIQTHSTNPLLKSATIDKAINKFLEISNEFDSMFSVTKLQTRLYWKDRKAINHNPEELLRTQDLPPVYEENSNFYIFTKDSFTQSENKRIGNNPFMFEIQKNEAIDIDEELDFLLAELLYKKFEGLI